MNWKYSGYGKSAAYDESACLRLIFSNSVYSCFENPGVNFWQIPDFEKESIIKKTTENKAVLCKCDFFRASTLKENYWTTIFTDSE